MARNPFVAPSADRPLLETEDRDGLLNEPAPVSTTHHADSPDPTDATGAAHGNAPPTAVYPDLEPRVEHYPDIDEVDWRNAKEVTPEPVRVK